MTQPATSAPTSRRRPAVRTFRVLRGRLTDLWRARELLRQFVAKELKVRYKNSALGFFWSLLTPALMTVVFTVIFSQVIPIEVTDFAAFFLSGFLIWQFFQNSVVASISCIVDNGPLIKKVYFPRELLPLSIVLSQLVHFLLALLAVSPFLIATRGWQLVLQLPAILAGVVLITIFTAGVAMFLAAANVTFRDLQELIVVIFMVWFYTTPVLYPFAMVQNVDSRLGNLAAIVLSYNPMTWLIRLVRGSVYGVVSINPASDASCLTDCTPFLSSAPTWPSLPLLMGTTAGVLVVFVIGYAMFHRFAVTFAKEI